MPLRLCHAMTRLAPTYHPDRGGTQTQMIRNNAAYEQARAGLENRPLTEKAPPRP
jgi:hypothetical protein